MSASVHLMVFDPESCRVMLDRWIGGNSVRDRAHEVLLRSPDHKGTGFASWGRVTVAEASRIAEAYYQDGLTPAEVEQLGVAHPSERFWWAMYVES